MHNSCRILQFITNKRGLCIDWLAKKLQCNPKVLRRHLSDDCTTELKASTLLAIVFLAKLDIEEEKKCLELIEKLYK